MHTSHQAKTGKLRLSVDKTVTLNINGSTQKIRMCGTRPDLPPILVVQAGPGFPMLCEVTKFQRRLGLEKDFLVYYWEQRGTGSASKRDATSVSMQRQTDDLRAVLRWVHAETNQAVILLGISVGGSAALRVAAQEPTRVKSVVAIAADPNIARQDAWTHSFLQQQASLPKNRRLIAKLAKLGEPPVTEVAPFQLRARMLADLGTIEYGKNFSSLMKETVFSMVGTYGVVGTAKALRNMSAVQNTMLPEFVSLDLLTDPPRLAMPVHYVFGEQDQIVPTALGKELAAAIAAPARSVTIMPNAGHMVHFDQPEAVRSIVMKARGT
jgi:pimeloyl-ACP methyl ester carboxylesterase